MNAFELPPPSYSFILSKGQIRTVSPAEALSDPRMTADRIRSFAQWSVVKTHLKQMQGAH
jgi:hypothetical protein